MNTGNKPPFPLGAWITEGPPMYLGKGARTFRRFEGQKDSECGSGYAVGGLDATYYRLAAPEEIQCEIDRLKARIADLKLAEPSPS